MVFQINIIFVGKLHNVHMLSGVGMATVLITTLPLSLTYGISGVLETLVSQAYGCQKYGLCINYLYKQIAIITILFIPISFILLNSETLMRDVFQQDEKAAYFCQELISIMLPGIYFDCIFESISLYFTAMEKSFIPMQIQMVMVPSHYLLNYLLMYKFDFGLRGVALATNITCLLCLVIIVVRMTFEKDMIFTLTNCRDILFDIKSFIRLAFAGLLLSCFEEWINNALSLFAGTIGVKEQAAFYVSYNIGLIMFFIPQSFSLSISALIGSALGKG